MSAASTLLGRLTDLITSPSEPKTVVAVPPSHVDPPIDDLPLDDETNPGYYRLWATSMFLEHDRRLHKTYFPAIAASASFSYGDDSTVVSSVITPMNAVQDITKSSAGNIVMRNQPLTPLIPFNGGSIRLGAALKSVEADDTLKAFAEAMSEISKVITWGPLSAGLSALDPINAGISRLLSLDGERYIAGFGEVFTVNNNPLNPGYIACIDALDGTVDPRHLWVKNSTLCYGRLGAEHAEPYRDHDYLLIQVETVRWRDDWRHVGKINDLFEEAVRLIGESEEGSTDSNTADNKIKSAILEAHASKDMTREQRILVGLQLGNEYKKNKGNYEKAAAAITDPNAPAEDYSLDDLAEMAFSVSDIKPSGMKRARVPSKSELPTLRELLRV